MSRLSPSATPVLASTDPLQSWCAGLARSSQSAARDAQDQKKLHRQVEEGLASWGDDLLECLLEWWTVSKDKVQGLELELLSPDGSSRALSFEQRVIRVGTDASCQLRLSDPDVPERQFEIRVSEDRFWLVPLDRSSVTRVNEQPVPAGQSLGVGTGDRIRFGDYEVRVGMQVVVGSRGRNELSLLGTTTLRAEEDPIGCLGGNAGHWLRVSALARTFLVRLPHSWIYLAYRELGWSAPGPRSGQFQSPIDRALTGFLAHQVAALFGERTGVECQVSGVLGERQARRLLRATAPQTEAFAIAHFGLELGAATQEVEVVFDPISLIEPADGNGQQGRSGSSPDLSDLNFEASVAGGLVDLSARDLRELDVGDVVLPDAWWLDEPALPSDPEPDGSTLRARLILPSLHGVDLTARVLVEPATGSLKLTSDFATGRDAALHTGASDSNERGYEMTEGMAMTDETMDEDVSPDPDWEEAPEPVAREPLADLDAELEVTLLFELGRVAIPLERLRELRSGDLLELGRDADDSVHIVLKQPTGNRLLGKGRAVVVEDRLGVQIESWLS